MRKFIGVTALFALCQGTAFAQEKKEKTLALQDLAPAVQKTIQAELKGEIKSIGKETEHGMVQYEVETMLNGKHRDFAGGKLGTVELFMRGGETMYEAAYTTKPGKKHEVLVKADSAQTKD